MTQPAKSNYFNALTGFRFLAASLVFVYHNRKYWRHDIHPELLRLINEFHVGVALFFVLSGFLIAYSYADKPLDDIKSYCRYFLIRIIRIMPVYWIILTAFYLDAHYGKGTFNWKTYSLVHAFSGKTNLQGIAQAWSLNVEMSFYLIAPFLYGLLRKNTAWLLSALLLLFILTLGVGYGWQAINGNPTHYFYPTEFVVNSTFAGRSFQFFAGMMLAFWLKTGQTKVIDRLKHKTLYGFTGIVALTYLIGCFQKNIYVSGTENAGGMILHNIILPVAIVIAIAGLMTEESWLKRFFSSRLLVLLGNASFAFYLIHISYVNLRISKLIMMPDRNFTLLWVVSILIYLLIEKPVYDRLRSLIDKK